MTGLMVRIKTVLAILVCAFALGGCVRVQDKAEISKTEFLIGTFIQIKAYSKNYSQEHLNEITKWMGSVLQLFKRVITVLILSPCITMLDFIYVSLKLGITSAHAPTNQKNRR